MNSRDHDSLLVSLRLHREPPRHVLLPDREKLIHFELPDEGPLVPVSDTSYGVGRAPDDTLPGGRFPLVIRRHTSISGGRAAILRYHDPGRVTVIRLDTGSVLAEVPVPPGVFPRCVLLIGDFIFVGGNGLGVLRMGGDQWQAIAVPHPRNEQRRGVDFIRLMGTTLWAVGAQANPLYAARWDLLRRDFAENAALSELGTMQPGASIEHFDCNDSQFVTLVRTLGVGRTNFTVKLYGETLGRLATTSQPERITGVALMGDLLFGALGYAGLGVVHLRDVRDGAVRWEHLASLPGQAVVDVVCCPHARRVFAITHGSGTHRAEFSLSTWDFAPNHP